MGCHRNLAKDFQNLHRTIHSFSDGQARVLDCDEDTIGKFTVEIAPNDGPYKGGKFKFLVDAVRSNEDWPNQPPRVACLTDIYHPNIDTEFPIEEGEDSNICLNLLEEEWLPTFSFEDVVQGLLFLFYEPNFDSPLSPSCTNDSNFEEYVRISIEGGDVEGRDYEMNYGWAEYQSPKEKEDRAGQEEEIPVKGEGQKSEAQLEVKMAEFEKKEVEQKDIKEELWENMTELEEKEAEHKDHKEEFEKQESEHEETKEKLEENETENERIQSDEMELKAFVEMEEELNKAEQNEKGEERNDTEGEIKVGMKDESTDIIQVEHSRRELTADTNNTIDRQIMNSESNTQRMRELPTDDRENLDFRKVLENTKLDSLGPFRNWKTCETDIFLPYIPVVSFMYVHTVKTLITEIVSTIYYKL